MKVYILTDTCFPALVVIKINIDLPSEGQSEATLKTPQKEHGQQIDKGKTPTCNCKTGESGWEKFDSPALINNSAPQEVIKLLWEAAAVPAGSSRRTFSCFSQQIHSSVSVSEPLFSAELVALLTSPAHRQSAAIDTISVNMEKVF